MLQRAFALAFVALVSALLSWLFGLARLLAQRAFLSLLCVRVRLRCATCHFKRSEKSTLSFCGYFANAQYDKQTLLLWLAFRFVFIAQLFATPFCHFELSLESENPKILVILSGVR